MKYKVGDKVRVREDLEVDKFYNWCRFNSSMAKQMGKVVTIKDVNEDEQGTLYFSKEFDYYWTEEMFSGLADEPRNLIPLIAKELGVEMGEEFYLRENFENDTNMNIYKFVEDGLKLNTHYGWKYVTLLDELLAGKYTIQKLPPKPKLTEAGRVILENIPEKYKYIARDNNGTLCVYEKKPEKGSDGWFNCCCSDLGSLEHLFQFIKWEDKEPYKIQELLEEYEKERIEDE